MEPIIRDAVQIGNEIEYNEVVDPRYRLNMLKIDFYFPFTAENALAGLLLADVLTYAHPVLNTERRLARWKKENYDARFETSVSSEGDLLTLTLSAGWLDDAFALDGENITQNMLDWLGTLLFSPAQADGGFCTPEFENLRSDYADYLDYMQREPANQIIEQVNALCYRGEPCAIPLNGSPEHADALTPQTLLSLWETILQTAPIRIYSTVPSESSVLCKWAQQMFGQLSRNAVPLHIEAPSPVKPEPETVHVQFEERTETEILLAYKYQDAALHDIAAVCDLLDCTTESLLFANIREKRSLCYECYAELEWEKHTVTLVCKTDAAHIGEVIALLKEQIALLQTGSFSDRLISVTDDAVKKERCAEWDRFSGIANTVRMRRLTGLPVKKSFDDFVRLQKITRGRIIAAANALTLDSVFIAEGTAQPAAGRLPDEGEEAADA